MSKNKSYKEMLDETIEKCEGYEEWLLPIYCYLGYRYGSMSKEEFQFVEKKDPATVNHMKQQIAKGESLFLSIESH